MQCSRKSESSSRREAQLQRAGDQNLVLGVTPRAASGYGAPELRRAGTRSSGPDREYEAVRYRFPIATGSLVTISRLVKRSLFPFVALLLVAATGCSSSSNQIDSLSEPPASAEEPAPAEKSAPAQKPAPAGTPVKSALPAGYQETIRMIKGDWGTEDPQVYVIKGILEEMGYRVLGPDIVNGPAEAFSAMVRGDADFWVNSLMPTDQYHLDTPWSEGGLIGDHVSIVGEMMLAGWQQGFLISKAFAEEYGITSLDDFNSNAEAVAAYDAQDSVPGDHFAQIYGCPEYPADCRNTFERQIALSGWRRIKQVNAPWGELYDSMFAEAVQKADAGEPVIAYVWTPSEYVTLMRPGDNALWLTVKDVVDEQRPGTARIGRDRCPGSIAGICTLGWNGHDVQAAASNDFLAANPAAHKMLRLFQMDVLEVSQMNLDIANGRDVLDLAAQWIDDNRDLVDTWIAAAS